MVEKSLLLSVIIPVYNAEKYLQRCVESVLQQSYSNFEIILVNDGSIDGTKYLCEDFEKIDSRIRLINKSNGGVSSARNLGIDFARGEWVTFVDADDWIEEGCFEELCKYFSDFNFDILVFGHMVHKEGKTYPGTRYINSAQTIAEFSTSTNGFQQLACWGYVFRHKIITGGNVRFRENLTMSEDVIFTLTYLGFCNTIYCVEKLYYNYNLNNESASGSKMTNKKAYDQIYAAECAVDLIAEHAILTGLASRIIDLLVRLHLNALAKLSFTNSLEYSYRCLCRIKDKVNPLDFSIPVIDRFSSYSKFLFYVSYLRFKFILKNVLRIR